MVKGLAQYFRLDVELHKFYSNYLTTLVWGYTILKTILTLHESLPLPQYKKGSQAHLTCLSNLIFFTTSFDYTNNPY